LDKTGRVGGCHRQRGKEIKEKGRKYTTCQISNPTKRIQYKKHHSNKGSMPKMLLKTLAAFKETSSNQILL